MRCSTPSSKMRKSFLLRWAATAPFSSKTITGICTSSTSVMMRTSARACERATGAGARKGNKVHTRNRKTARCGAIEALARAGGRLQLRESYTPRPQFCQRANCITLARVRGEKKKAGNSWLPAGKSRRMELFNVFGEDGELQFGLGKRLHHCGLSAFRGSVSRSGHLADEEVLCALQHFLFAEGKRLAAAEGDEALEDDGDFEEGPGAHALRVFLEAVFPVVMRVEFAGFEEAKDFGGFRGTNNGTKANSRCV